ncbi:hypothetical protein GH733_019463 [Mirounga leonina]|nr:hypothetical protein GH733_019463 [Mirounga leonina]
MKVFELIGGMVILTSVFSACAAQSPMTVLCSLDWFMVTVHPFMLNNDVYVHFHELHLGLGCPANHVQPHAYQFTYRVTDCGIRAKAVSLDMGTDMGVAGGTGPTTQHGGASYDVFTLSQSSQRPCVFGEEERIQAPRHQGEAQEGLLVQPSAFVDISEDWSLRSDDLIESIPFKAIAKFSSLR